MEANMKNFDFTTWRKGIVVSQRNGKVIERIDICPVCGRKGAVRRSYFDGAGVYHPVRIIHTAQIVLGAFLQIDQSCTHFESFGYLMMDAARRSWKARKLAKHKIPDSDWPPLPFEAA
jgi:hypothetical protein